MNRKSFLLISALLFVALAALYLSTKLPTTSQQQKNPTPTQTTVSYCTQDQVATDMSLEPAAGNVYGMLTLKNISKKSCTIFADKQLRAAYAPSVKNLAFNYQGMTTDSIITINPGQTIYSQLHYPNGPQCSSGIVSTPIVITYQISPQEKITFTNENNNGLTVTTCKDPDEITTLDLWYLAEQPITP